MKCDGAIKFKKLLDNSLIGLLASQKCNLFDFFGFNFIAVDNKQTKPREFKNYSSAMWVAIALGRTKIPERKVRETIKLIKGLCAKRLRSGGNENDGSFV